MKLLKDFGKLLLPKKQEEGRRVTERRGGFIEFWYSWRTGGIWENKTQFVNQLSMMSVLCTAAKS